ncbi:cold-shock protein [Thiopseudomonas alkaliphila]|uniref:Cold-shock protein n=1 Tax=Thiopseudomonas alkaliphila TaxID=1697053 RepID=A0A0K1XCZ3_9GAMM|nr:cold-shock protein [Thiopseudomonas alkaliphila]AKX59265.1 cold-shock protein [Thiopseudomonas alkaliphila]MDM1716353.1 cold shock domain-containing protein [Thiopseudomonas alkaliphila]
MLKLLHLITGALALVLALYGVQFLSNHSHTALLLATFGLIHLILAPIVPNWARGKRRSGQLLTSALMVAATALLAFAMFTKPDATSAQALASTSFSLLLLATVLHLMLNLRKVVRKASPLSQDLTDRETGTVKWFNTSKGFGFISRDQGDDIFVHFRAIRGEGHRVLVEGQRVEYTVMEREKGLQAEDVIAALPEDGR